MLTEKDVSDPLLPRNTWLVIFADIIALLFAFFVMLFSTREINTETWNLIIAQDSSLEMSTKIENPQLQAKHVETFTLNQALSLQYLAKVLEEHLSVDPLLDTATVHSLDGLVVISLPSDAMFDSGSIALRIGAREALFRMGGIIATISNHIDVRGHTDPLPASDLHLGSKWSVSLARAAAVANELRRSGFGRQIPIFGLSDTRFEHLDRNIPEAKRLALSRRVDVFIHPHPGEI
ncbi:MAG: hypothetical protein CFH10_00014 [Alphaproteobacteria bacterium MarineAlpha4_Bin2]|nr:MAG: hypothetical protein CFH10_00014 [Alphaproteobacteria bacterium MarineAlpha4_Bin2]